MTDRPAAISSAAAWWHAARPHTLSLSAVPVCAGCVLAWQPGEGLDVGVALAVLLAAVCIQIGTNLLNDVGDFERGADTPNRAGQPRATAQGWLSPAAVRRAGLAALAAALLAGVYPVWIGGWPMVVLGLVSLLCGWAYTSGPYPIAYGPFGEAFVWLFFGVVAVAGSYWLQTGALSAPALWLGHSLGALAAAVLLVNNTRDAATDVPAGRRTLASRLTRNGCTRLYALLLAQPYLCLPLVSADAAPSYWLWLPCLSAPAAAWLAYRFARLPAAAPMNALLAQTAKLQTVWTVLFAVGLLAVQAA